MAQQPDPSSGWTTYEVFQRDSSGKYTVTPFSDVLATSGILPVQPISKMRMLEGIGWPQAKRHLKDNCGKPLIVKKDDLIWASQMQANMLEALFLCLGKWQR